VNAEVEKMWVCTPDRKGIECREIKVRHLEKTKTKLRDRKIRSKKKCAKLFI
jgi:ribosomal protein L14E/L6E/L27E